MVLQEIFSPFDIEQFWQEFFLTGTPVVFRGLSTPHLQVDELVLHIKDLLIKKEAKSVGVAVWLPSDKLEKFIPLPPCVSRCLVHQDTHFLYKDSRLFSCPGGHRTSWHYDANLLFNFNFQLVGAKKWTLLSPNHPRPCYGFSQFGLIGESYRAEDNQSCAIVLNAGDMLYVPPLWMHQVIAIEGQDSLSVSWMAVNDKAIMPSKTLQREKELLKIATILKKFNLDHYLVNLMQVRFASYAGQGWHYIEHLTSDISIVQALARVLKEIYRKPQYFLHRKRIITALKKPEMIFFKNKHKESLYDY